VTATLRGDVDRILARGGPSGVPAPQPTVPPNVQEHLRALGYLAGATPGGATPPAAGP